MSHPTDKIVGQRIREARWLRGMTQHALATAVGIKFQQVQKYEVAANRVSASRLLDLSQALDLPITYFFEGADTRLDESAPVIDQDTGIVAAAIAELPPRERRAILRLVQSMAGATA